MSANQHTPGPWINRVGPSTDLIIESTSDALFAPMIATVSRWHESGHQLEALANARLIAAAPDLLAFAESVAALGRLSHANMRAEEFAVMVDSARAAIARATGSEAEASV